MARTATNRSVQAPGYVQLMFRDSNGYPMGVLTDPNTPGTDTTTHAYVIPALITYTPGVVVRPVVTNQASLQVKSRTRHAATDYGTIVIDLSEDDDTLHALTSRTTIDVSTSTDWAYISSNATQSIFDPFIILINILSHNEDTGLDEWKNIAVLNTEFSKTADSGATQITGDATNPNPSQYSTAQSTSCRDITGYLLSALGTAAENDKDTITTIITDSPLTVTTYVQDAIETDIILGYEPTTTDATGKGTNSITTEGLLDTAASVVLATKTVTLTGVGSSGDITVVAYETDKLGASC